MPLDPAALPDDYLAFLLAERHLATLTTLRSDGTPHVVPVGFTYEPATRTVRVITSRTSVKARNLADGGRAVVCQVDRGRWATLEGDARVTDDADEVADAVRRYGERYQEPRENPRAGRAHDRGRPRAGAGVTSAPPAAADAPPGSVRGTGTSTADQHARGTSGLAAVTGATLVFSWGFIIVKALPLPGPTIATWRLVLGGAVLAAVGGLRRSAWPARKGPMILAGLAFGVHQLLFIAATQATSVAIVTLLAACQPLLVALVSSRVVGERVPRALVGWSALAVGGVAMVVLANLGDESASLHGNLLAVANLLVFVVYFLATKRGRTDDVAVETFTAGTFAVGALVTAPGLLLVAPTVPSGVTPWALIALLALVPGNGHLLVNWAHPRVTAALSSLVLAALPGAVQHLGAAGSSTNPTARCTSRARLWWWPRWCSGSRPRCVAPGGPRAAVPAWAPSRAQPPWPRPDRPPAAPPRRPARGRGGRRSRRSSPRRLPG